MPKMVFIRELNDRTFLHLSTQGESFRLRDYSLGAHTPPREVGRQIPGRTTTTILEMARRPGNLILDAPGDRRLENVGFWHPYVIRLNAQYLRPGGTPDGKPADIDIVPEQGPSVRQPSRLLDRFDEEIAELLSQGDTGGLKSAVGRWLEHFRGIADKTVTFNHWCRDPAGHLWTPDTGIGWTAAMLDYSRREGKVHYIEAGAPRLDFALLSMDLNLTVPAGSNRIEPGREDTVKPDGLAVRRDGSAAVLEVKGPRDSPDLRRAIIQGFCGALAIYARREMLTRVARAAAGLRPAIPAFDIPVDVPSLGIYVLVDANGYAIGQAATYRAIATQLREALPAIREVVLFAVDPRRESFPDRIPYDIAFG